MNNQNEPPKKGKAQSYDNKFLDKELENDDYKLWKSNKTKFRAATTNAFDTEVHRINFDSSNQDYVNEGLNPLLNQFVDLQAPDPYSEVRAANQGWTSKASSGIGRTLAKVGAEVAKMPGVIGGIAVGGLGQIVDGVTGEDNTDFVKTAFDNEWINTINNINEDFNTEVLPVYVKKAVQEGSLWDQITSIDFWATEGADGVGYIASMMVPGTIISKANLGVKFTSMFGKTEKARKLLMKAGLAGNKANVKMAALGNTIFEAGAEAQGAMEGYRAAVEQKFNSGEITEKEYLEMLSKDSEVGRNVFLANAAILIGPNYLMSKMMHGAKGVDKIGQKFDKTLGKYVTDIKAPTKILDRIDKSGQQYGKAFLSEGLWEEGMQMTSENYFKEKALDKDSKLTFLEAYTDMIGSTDGQKAVFLGGALGGGMMSYQGRKSDVAKEKGANRLSEILTSGLKDFSNFHKNDVFKTKESNGKEMLDLDKDGQPQLDMTKVISKLNDLGGSIDLNMQYQLAIAKNDTVAIEQLEDYAMTSFISNFLPNGEMGLQLLEDALENSGVVDDAVKDEVNPIKNKKEYKEKVMAKARELHKFNEMYQSFEDIIKVNDSRAIDDDYLNFKNQLHSEFLSIVSNVDFFNNKVKNLNSEKSKIINNEKLENQTIEEFENENKNDDRLIKINNQLEVSNKELKDLVDKRKNFFKSENHTQKFKEYVDKMEQIRQMEKDGIVDTVDNITNAETSEDLDKVLEGEYFTKKDRKQKDFLVIKKLVTKLNKNPNDLKTANEVLNELINGDIQSYNIDKLLGSIKFRIKNLKTQEKKFLEELENLTQGKMTELDNISELLSTTEKNIQELSKRTELVLSSVQELGNKKRKSKEVKKLIEDYTFELVKTEEAIQELTYKKELLTNEKNRLDKEINVLLTTIELTPSNNFKSLQEALNFLKQDKEAFTKHRLDVSVLMGLRQVSQETIDSLQSSINYLTKYKEVLQESLALLKEPFKDALVKDIDNEEFDRYIFFSNEYDNTVEELNQLQGNLKNEKAKLDRLKNAIIDKEVSLMLEEEIEVIEKLQIYENINKSVKYKDIVFENKIIEKLTDFELANQEKEESLNEEEEEFKEEEKQVFEAFLNYIKNIQGKEDNRFVVSSDLARTLKVKGLTAGTIIEIDKLTPKFVSISFNDQKARIKITDFFNGVKSELFNFSTEGGLNETFEEYQVVDDLKNSTIKNDTKLLSTDSKGNPLSFISQSFIDYERNPNIVKIGKQVTFEINEGLKIRKENSTTIERNIVKNKQQSINNVSKNNDKYKGLSNEDYVTELYDENGNFISIASHKYKNQLALQIEKHYEDLINSLEDTLYEVTNENFKQEWKDALKMFKQDPSKWDVNFLVKYLPINVVFNEYTKTPINTYYENSKGDASNFNNTTAKLRRAVINELKNGTRLSELSVFVKNQLNGELQIEEEVLENKLHHLEQFEKQVSKIKSEDFYIVDDTGYLKNSKGLTHLTRRQKAPGEVYLLVKTANGKKFPLKLNVAKIKRNEAEVLYDIYNYRFQKDGIISKSTTLAELEQQDPELYETVIDTFKSQIDIINKKNLSEVSLKDIIDFMIWDGATSPKSQVRFSGGKTTYLYVGDKRYSQTKFNTVEGKENFISFLTNSKRHHIKFKSPKTDALNNVNFSNREYVKYLIENGILNTNAKVEGPLFQGNTAMYLDTFSLMKNNELSSFNEEVTLFNKNKDIIIPISKVNKDFAVLKRWSLKLNKNRTKYLDALEQEYNRVSELKGVTGDISIESTVRGDVLDELFRDFFSRSTPHTLDVFLTKANETLFNVSKTKKLLDDKDKPKVNISEKAFKEYYNILTSYSEEFKKKGWQIYTNLKPIGGRLGNNTDGRKNVLFAGTIDVLVYDTKKKEYYVLDLKTNTTSRTAAYNDPKTDKFNYKEKDSIQLSAYKQLIEYATNKDSKSEPIKITKGFILPLLTKKVSKNDFSIDSVEMESKSLLEVSLNADINKLVEDYKKRPTTKTSTSKDAKEESTEKVSYSKSKFKIVSDEGTSRIFEDLDDAELNSLLIEKKFLVIDEKVTVPNQVDKKLVATYPVDRNGLKKGVQIVELTFFLMENGKKKYFNPELSKLLTAETPFFFTNFGKAYRNASKQVELRDNVVYFEVSKVLTGQKQGLELIKKIPTTFTFKEETKNKWLEIWNNENNFVSLQPSSNNSNAETITTTVTTTTTKGKKIIKTIEESVDLSEIGEAELNEFTDSTLLAQAKLEYDKSGKKSEDKPTGKITPKINNVFNIDSLKPEAVEELLTEISEMSFANIETSQIGAILESETMSEKDKLKEVYSLVLDTITAEQLNKLKEKC